MPLRIAAVQTTCDPAFGLYSVQATIHSCAVRMLVWGPIVGSPEDIHILVTGSRVTTREG